MDQVFAVKPVCEKYQAKGERCILGVYGFWKRPMIGSISAWYVANVKSVWS